MRTAYIQQERYTMSRDHRNTNTTPTHTRFVSIRFDKRRVDAYEHSMTTTPVYSRPFTDRAELVAAMNAAGA
jgi:hypothetical protein